MTDEEIRNKLESIRNRCRIAIFLFDVKLKYGQESLPKPVYEAIVTILEDICQDYQYILEKCTGENWEKS